MSLDFVVHTDFGHDPDDAIALAYLFEHGYCPKSISISPGFWDQQLALSGLISSYYSYVVCDIELEAQPKATLEESKYNAGKHKMFIGTSKYIFFPLSEHKSDKALIIGPAKGVADNIECEELFFQGGYSPNSIAPLEKFAGVTATQSFNPNGSGADFEKFINSPKIKRKYFIGKNVCHGFTKTDLGKIWMPENPLVRKFWNQLREYKAMHDVLAAMLMVDKSLGIWEQAKPVRVKNGWTTEPTTDEIFSLIGIK